MAEVGEGKGGGAGGGEAPASRRPPARPRLASPSPHPGTARPRLALPLHLIPSPGSSRARPGLSLRPRAPPARVPSFLLLLLFLPFLAPRFPRLPRFHSLPHARHAPLLSSLTSPPLTLSTPSGALRVRGPLPTLSFVFAGGWDKWGILTGEGSTG